MSEQDMFDNLIKSSEEDGRLPCSLSVAIEVMKHAQSELAQIREKIAERDETIADLRKAMRQDIVENSKKIATLQAENNALTALRDSAIEALSAFREFNGDDDVWATMKRQRDLAQQQLAERDKQVAELQLQLLNEQGHIVCKCGRLWTDDVDFSHCDCGRHVDQMFPHAWKAKLAQADEDREVVRLIKSLTGNGSELVFDRYGIKMNGDYLDGLSLLAALQAAKEDR